MQAGAEGKTHPLTASTLKGVSSTNIHNSSGAGDGRDAGGAGGVGGDAGEEEEEEGGGFSGIRMESVKDIIAKARFAESFLRGGSGVDLGENLDDLAQIVDQECKEEGV